MKKKITELKKACKAFSHHIIMVDQWTNDIISIKDRSSFEGCIRDLVKIGVMIYITGGIEE